MGDPRSDDPGELPVACTLGPDDGPARMRRWRRLADGSKPTASRNGRTLEVHFEPGAGVHGELAALAAVEQDCCSFVTWEVTEDDGHPVLRVHAESGSPDDVAPIAAMFGAT